MIYNIFFMLCFAFCFHMFFSKRGIDKIARLEHENALLKQSVTKLMSVVANNMKRGVIK